MGSTASMSSSKTIESWTFAVLEHYRQWDAPWVRNKVALGALLSFIRRIRCGFSAPLLAGMDAESSEARSHSI